MSDISQIDGQSVRLKRETMGWAMADMATLACLSVKQIKQIEEGGTSAFYSESVKLTAARKVAALLHMTDAQLFGQQPLPDQPDSLESDTSAPPSNASLAQSSFALPSQLAAVSSEPSHASLTRSETLHVLAQPPEHIEDESSPASPEAASDPADAAEQQDEPAQLPPASAADEHKPTAGAPSSGGYMLKIFALFLVALAVAAFLRPKAGEEKTEPDSSAAPPPPIQVVPGATENATSPSEAQPVASGTSATLPATTDKTADKPAEKPVDAASNSASSHAAPAAAATDKARSTTAPDKPAPVVEKPAATPATPAAPANK